MGSLYGRGNYGAADYGFAFTTLAGTATTSFVLGGDFRNATTRLSASIDFASALNSPWFDAEMALEGSAAGTFDLSGALRVITPIHFTGTLAADIQIPSRDFVRIRGYNGLLEFTPVLSATEWYNPVKFFGGNIAPEFVLRGNFRNAVHRLAATLTVTSRVAGDLRGFMSMRGYISTQYEINGDEFIGYFWTPIPAPGEPWEVSPNPPSPWTQILPPPSWVGAPFTPASWKKVA